MNLTDIRDALLSVLPKAVFHFQAPSKTKAPYAVWAEDGSDQNRHADNELVGQAIQGTVDYFTREEYDKTVERIQKAFTVRHIPFRLNSIQYETDTKLIHYEWVWNVWQR